MGPGMWCGANWWICPLMMLAGLCAMSLMFWFFMRHGVGRILPLLGHMPMAVGPTGSAETALDLLRKRYAKGEISRDEFLRVKADIEG